MNKAEFLNSVYKSGKYSTKVEAEKAYNAVVNTLATRLTKGDAKERVIRLPELGTFQMKTRKARTGRNPQTGQPINIPSKKVVTFRVGKDLSTSL